MSEEKQTTGDNIFTVIKWFLIISGIALLFIGKYVSTLSIKGKISDPEIEINSPEEKGDEDTIIESPKKDTNLLKKPKNNEQIVKTEAISVGYSPDLWVSGKWKMIIYKAKCGAKKTMQYYTFNLNIEGETISGNGNKTGDEEFGGKNPHKYLIPCKISGTKLGGLFELVLKESSSKGSQIFETKILIDKILNENSKITGTFENNSCIGFLEMNKIED